MKKTNLFKKGVSMALSLVLAMTAVVLCAVVTAPDAKAATTRSVASFSEFQTALDKSASGDTIKITDPFTVDATTRITKNITLTCSHGDTAKNQDISRAKGFHGSIFVVDDDATLTLRCCVSGNAKAKDDGAYRGYGATNKEGDGYYGEALIRLDDGNLVMDSDKSILKNNYNVGTQGDAKWEYDDPRTDEKTVVTYYADANNTHDTKAGRTGSAVYGYHGSFTMTAGRIYNCCSDNGPALYFASGYSGDKARITGGQIYNNVARRFGGAIFSIRRENNKYTATQAEKFSFSGKRTLDSDGGNAKLTISGTAKIHDNVSNLGGGGIWSGHGATLYMTGGEIYNNIAVASGGGGIRTNAGDVSSINTNSSVCMGLPGGETKITDGEIYNNYAAGNGGGVQVARMSLDGATSAGNANVHRDNKFTMTGGAIYNNTSTADGGGIVTQTQTYITGGRIGSGTALSRGNKAGGSGAGIYVGELGHLEMTGGAVSYNTATGSGGGIYLVSGGDASKIVDAEIYNNKAVNGGGVASNRRNGLTVGGSTKVYSNTASNDGGGLYTKGVCTVNNGYIYANNPSGVHAESGTLNVKGGKYGFSSYSNGSTYEVSRNTYAQMVIASGATCNMSATNDPRFITSLASGEGVDGNFGIRNHGTVETGTSGKVIFFGTGTSVYNNGNFDVKCSFNVQSSEKAGATTQQMRLGIHNTKNGVLTVDHEDFEVKYCGRRGVYNEGKFTLINGSIHHNTVPDTTSSDSSNKGAGVCNTGSNAVFEINDGTITSNSAYYGGGVYNTGSASLIIKGGTISKNSAVRGAGVYNTTSGTTTMSAGVVRENSATVSGGGVHNNGTFTMSQGSIERNKGTEYGGGVFTGDGATTTITNGSISNNTDTVFGAGISNGGTLNVSGGSIHSNVATEYGGGIFTDDEGNTTISGGKIRLNNAWYGGGLYVLTGGSATVSGGTIGGTATNTSGGTEPVGNVASHGGGGIANTGTVTLKKNVDVSYNLSENGVGGGIYNDGIVSVEGGKIHDNSATENGFGGGVYTYSNGNTTISGGDIYNNIAYKGGGVYNTNQTTLNGTTLIHDHDTDEGGAIYNAATMNIDGGKFYNNYAIYGGGIYNEEDLTVSGGYFYSNANGGVYTGAGTTYIKGGYHGFSDYTDDNTYTVARNSPAQIMVGELGNTIVYGTGKVRVVSSLNSGEAITKNAGIENEGGFVVDATCTDFAIFGEGVGLNNTGTVTAYGCMKITNSEKAGTTKPQKRVGILNKEGGEVTLSSDLVDISYCGNRGIENNGLVTVYGGKIHHNEISGNGAGIYNNSELWMEGGHIYANEATENGGGVYVTDSATFLMVDGAVGGLVETTTSSASGLNQAKNGAGVYVCGEACFLGGEVSYNLADTNGGGIYIKANPLYDSKGFPQVAFEKNVDGNGEIVDKIKIKGNSAVNGGGVFFDGALENLDSVDGLYFNIQNCEVSENTATSGAGVYVRGSKSYVDLSGGKITKNEASNAGGGVYLSDAVLDMTGGEITYNEAVVNGGGVFVGQTASFNMSGGKIDSNAVGIGTTGAADSITGGGVHSVGNTNITGGTISNNKSRGLGGGVCVWSGTCDITDATISNNGAYMGAGVYNHSTLNMKNVAVTNNGSLSGENGEVDTHSGGGVGVADNAISTTINKCVFTNNKADYGGGLFTAETTSTNTSTSIKNSTFEGNKASESGGGLYSNAPLSVIGCTISNNDAKGAGGGVCVWSGTTNISGTTINSNTAYQGAGIFNHSSAILKNTAVKENGLLTATDKKVATYSGGGIFTSARATLELAKNTEDSTLEGNVIFGNKAECGGGIFIEGSVIYTDAEIKENEAKTYGGGIFVSNTLTSPLTLTNVIKIHDNTALYGGGVFTRDSLVLNGVDVHDNTATKRGGGVYVDGKDGILDFVKGYIRSNRSSWSGGGVYVAGGTLNMTGGKIGGADTDDNGNLIDKGNTSALNGGGIYLDEDAKASTISGGEISYNKNTGAGEELDLAGGGIYTLSKEGLTITGPYTKIHHNLSKYGGGVCSGKVNTGMTEGKLTITGGEFYENEACWGGAVHNSLTLNVSGGDYHDNEVSDTGGAFFNLGNATITGVPIHSNTASYSGGGLTNCDKGVMTITDCIVGNNEAQYGGGLFDGGLANKCELVINSGYVYNNVGGGVYEGGGKTTINGGYYGFSVYNSDSDYVVSRNGRAQIITSSIGTVEVTGVNKTRVISALETGESISDNAGILNGGEFTVLESCKEFNIYGVGVGINNTGTVNANGAMRITTSEKLPLGSLQNRLGIWNRVHTNGRVGVVNLNSDKVEVSYCGRRGVYNEGKFYSTGGSIHHCSSDYLPVVLDEKGSDITSRRGSGIYNKGLLDLTNTSVNNNIAEMGGGIYIESGAQAQLSGCVVGYNKVITDALSRSSGGGIDNRGTLTLKNTSVNNNSSAGIGGGINTTGTLDIQEGTKVFANTSGKEGAGISVDGEGVANVSDATIGGNTPEKGNVAGFSGGGVALLDSGKLSVSSGVIANNSAKYNGGGIYVTKTSVVEISGGSISSNTAENLGGGVYTSGDATVTMTGATIGGESLEEGNVAKSSGGGVALNGSNQLTVSGGKVLNNTAQNNGGGIYTSETSKVTMTSGEISNNIAKNNGGGIYNRGTLDISGGEVSNNTATNNGGGVYVAGILNIEDGVKIFKNKAVANRCGGGIYADGENAVVNMTGGEISENIAGIQGGGVTLYCNGPTFNMSGGVIKDNKAEDYIDGVMIYPGATFNMTGGLITGNNSSSMYGVYLRAPKDGKRPTLNMSGDAKVDKNNTVHLESGTYISVPSEFTGEKDVKAYVSGDMWLGRVVAKNTGVKTDGSETLNGTEVLYHTPKTPNMDAQYFASISGKMLRAGDQGAAKTGAVTNQDVFISEAYTVDFDMNPEAFSFPDITHTIDGVGEWEFPDGVLGGYVNEDVYTKYWYEDLTINLGVAEASEGAFGGWNTDEDGSGVSYEENAVVKLVGTSKEVNQDKIYYAQWLTEQIEINYLGNGATDGHDYTETGVNSSEKYYDMENGEVDEGDENVHKRPVGKPVFERVEDVTDEEGNVIDTKLYSFEGWSLSQRPTSDDAVWKLGQKDVKMELFKNVLQPANANTTVYRLLRAAANTKNAEGKELETYEGTNDKSYANVYAVWDQYPKIYAVNRTFTLEEAQAGLITLEELMDTEYAFACDGFDKKQETIYQLDENGDIVTDENGEPVALWEGKNTNFYDTESDGKLKIDGFESFTIVDYAAEDFTSFKSAGSKTVTFCAVDRVGNTTIKTITVYITDGPDDGSTIFTRFISDRYFKDSEGNFVSEENGGFNEKSNWVNDEGYIEVLEKVFANKKSEETGKWNTEYEVWTWNKESIEKAKQFVEDEGLGNVKAKDSLDRFRARFGPVKSN